MKTPPSERVNQLSKELHKVDDLIVEQEGDQPDQPLKWQLFVIAELALSALENELERLEKKGELQVDLSLLSSENDLEDSAKSSGPGSR